MSLLEKILVRSDAEQIIAQAQERLQKEWIDRRNFYKDLTPSVKAEFIAGSVVVHSPVWKEHNAASLQLAKLIDTYVSLHDLGFVGIEKILLQCSRNDYEPDLCFFGNEKAQHFKTDQMFFPAPDFVVEIISKSTEHIDRKVKFQDYAMHGVREYWLVVPNKQTVEQYTLINTAYELVKKHSDDDVINVLTIKGLSFSVAAIFDVKANLKALQNILK